MIQAVIRNHIVPFHDAYNHMYHKSMRNVTWVVTHNCNLKCTYCYEHCKDNAVMSLDVAKKFADLLFDMDEQNSDYINPINSHALILEFIGGEPLLQTKLINDTLDYFFSEAIRRNHRWATQYMISMTSNGLNYFEPEVQNMLNQYAGHINITITVDGSKETHDACRVDKNGNGSYDRSIAAFRDARYRFNQATTKFTIAPGNVDNVFDACKDIVTKFDLLEFHCNCCYEEGWETHHATTLYYQLKKIADWVFETERYDLLLTIFDEFAGHYLDIERNNENWCGGTGKMIACDCDGIIYPCLRYTPISMDKRPLLRIGDIDHQIGILSEDKKNVEELTSITRISQSLQKCLECPIGSGCGWCSAYNYEKMGSVNKRATFICQMHQARVLASSYYWNKYHQHFNDNEYFDLQIPKDWALEIIPEDEYNMLMELDKH